MKQNNNSTNLPEIETLLGKHISDFEEIIDNDFENNLFSKMFYYTRNEFIKKDYYGMSYNVLNTIKNALSDNNSYTNRVFAHEIIDSGLDKTLISASPFIKYPDGSNYSSTYPELTSILKDYIPTFKDDERLTSLISELTGLSESRIKDDLTWGEGPEVHIAQLGIYFGQEIKGRFRPTDPDKIFFDIDLVNKLEAMAKIPNPTEDQEKQLGVMSGLMAFAVCLHEYVHYADFAHDGIMQDTRTLELGEYFEELFVGGYFEIMPNGEVRIIIID